MPGKSWYCFWDGIGNDAYNVPPEPQQILAARKEDAACKFIKHLHEQSAGEYGFFNSESPAPVVLVLSETQYAIAVVDADRGAINWANVPGDRYQIHCEWVEHFHPEKI